MMLVPFLNNFHENVLYFREQKPIATVKVPYLHIYYVKFQRIMDEIRYINFETSNTSYDRSKILNV